MTVEALTLKPGDIVADLQINAVLGENGRDVSYLVTDPAIGTRFVLREYLPTDLVQRDQHNKLAPVDGPSGQLFENGLKEFLKEARMTASLDHPNIARVLRFFQANGTAYFLMPYYEGQTLEEKLRGGKRLDRLEAKTLLMPLMEALEHLHKKDVIHRAIRPSNIVVQHNLEPVLIDFRFAAGVSGDSGLAQTLEQSPYAAPEQLTGHGSVGPWTDIYAMAACMYECVSGKPPASAMLRTGKLDAGDKDPLSPVSQAATGDQLGGLSDAIDQGLNLDIEQRPQDVAHWRKTFQSLDWHRSVVVPGDTGGHESEKKERLPAVLLALFVVVMISIGIVLLSDWSPDKYPVTREETAAEPTPATEAEQRRRAVDSEERKRWQAALEADTIQGYRRFLEDYPGSIYADQAQIQLDILDERHWSELSAENSVPAYERYLELFPAGIHQATALQRIEAIQQAEALKERQRLAREQQERLAWEAASRARTIEAMDRYINDWPAGSHIEEATRIRRLLQDQANDDEAFKTALKLNRIDAFQAYIDAFPKGANVTKALQYIDDLTLRPGKTFRDCQYCPEMVVIPPGNFWQGAAEQSEMALDMEKPRRMVTIDAPFAVSRHEITMAQWDRCFEDGGCRTLPEDNGWGRGNRPVIMVSWNDAQEYVRWLSEKSGNTYRLPSESEWEYFARAGEEGDWPGGEPGNACDYGNIAGAETGFRWQHEACSDKLAMGTAPVGSFKANAFGIYDTTGNVSEWTADCMNLSYLDAPVDGSNWGRGICSSHMTRGGSWITGTRDIRLPARFNLKNGDKNDFTGFRVVRNIEE